MDWAEILQNILVAVISATAPALIGMVAVWIKLKRDEFMNTLDERYAWAIPEAARIAVLAAEQSGLAGLILNEAEVKKRYAIEVAEGYLQQYHIDVDLDVISALIEAAVIEQFGEAFKDRGLAPVVVNSA